MAIVTLGIDLGKNVCSVAGLDAFGRVVMNQRIRRFRLLSYLTDMDPCVVAMEACGGAHHIARHCQAVGHEPRLMSPLYVRPYVKVHKTDDRDAVGITDARGSIMRRMASSAFSARPSWMKPIPAFTITTAKITKASVL